MNQAVYGRSVVVLNACKKIVVLEFYDESMWAPCQPFCDIYPHVGQRAGGGIILLRKSGANERGLRAEINDKNTYIGVDGMF